MKYYLIDYENVNASGLDGIEKLSQDSQVVIFYTRNSSKIDLNMLNLLLNMDTNLKVIAVHHGKQALDIQLGSYVGFLVGTEGKDSEYNIISKDKGYRNIQEFWADQRINLYSSIRQAVRQKQVEESGEEADEANGEAKASPSKKRSPGRRKSSAKKAEQNTVQNGSSAARGNEKGAAGEDASSAGKPDDSERGKVACSSGRREEQGKGKSDGEAAPQKASELRNEVNTEIQKRLSKAGYPGDLINGTASFVSRNIGKEGYKQTIYRGIIKELGQKQGLEVYRQIKDLL